MRFLPVLLNTLVTAAAVALEPRVNYDGYHVFSVRAADHKELHAIEEQFARYHLIHDHRYNAIEIAIPPNEIRSFKALRPDARLLNSDLGKQIREEAKPATYKRSLRKRGDLPGLNWFDTYHTYKDHLEYWDDLVEAFPNNTAKLNIGLSFEGRDIYAFNIWGDKGKKGKKPAIIWHATVHAREWISTMVCLS